MDLAKIWWKILIACNEATTPQQVLIGVM